MTEELQALADQMAEALKDHFLARDLDASGAALDRMEALHNEVREKFGDKACQWADSYANTKGHELAAPHLDSAP